MCFCRVRYIVVRDRLIFILNRFIVTLWIIYNKPIVKFKCKCCSYAEYIEVRDTLILILIYCKIMDDLQ